MPTTVKRHHSELLLVLSKERLENLYLHEKLSYAQIGGLLGVSKRTVGHYGLKYGIVGRSRGYPYPKRYRTTPKIEMPQDPAILGYLAGLVDGEGCIGIYLRRDGNQNWKPREIIYMSIRNTDGKLLNFLKSLFPHSKCVYYAPAKGSHKPSWTFTLKGYIDVHTFLKVLEPYLVVKKDKAREAILTIEKHLDIGGQHG